MASLTLSNPDLLFASFLILNGCEEAEIVELQEHLNILIGCFEPQDELHKKILSKVERAFGESDAAFKSPATGKIFYTVRHRDGVRSGEVFARLVPGDEFLEVINLHAPHGGELHCQVASGANVTASDLIAFIFNYEPNTNT